MTFDLPSARSLPLATLPLPALPLPALVLSLVVGGALAVFARGEVRSQETLPASAGSAPAAEPAPTGEDASWPSFRGDPAQHGFAKGRLSKDLVVRWSFTADKPVASSPVIGEGLVFFGCDDGDLYAVDLESGELRWRATTGLLDEKKGEVVPDLIEAPPLVLHGQVSIGSNDGVVYTYSCADGHERWRFATEGKIVGGVNHWRFEDEDFTRLYIGSYDNSLHCVRADTGELLFSYLTDNYVNGTPAVADGKVVFGGCDCVLHVVDGRTGEALRKVELGGSANVAGSVAVDDGAAWFGHYSNAFLGVDLGTGAPRWVYSDSTQPFVAAPAVAEGRVVFGGDDRVLRCVDEASGEERWQFRTRKKLGSSPVICDGKVVLGTAEGRLHLLSLENGDELWSFDVGKSIAASPAVAGGRVVIASLDGVVRAFGPAAAAGSGTPPQPQQGAVR